MVDELFATVPFGVGSPDFVIWIWAGVIGPSTVLVLVLGKVELWLLALKLRSFSASVISFSKAMICFP